MRGPTSHSYFSQRLRLHYVDWGNPEAPPLLLVHGGQDHCRNWDWVAEDLSKDYHIIAPDLRGHGDSEWIKGGSYLVMDYVYDIAQLIDQKNMTPVNIIAHSMGGGISLLYASLYPEKINKLAIIEGLGLGRKLLEQMLNRPLNEFWTDWISDMHKMAGRTPRRYKSIQEAFERMQAVNPHLSEAQARHLTIHGANQNEDGTYTWKFDNYTRVFPGFGVPFDKMEKMWSRITAPTLLIRGTESWASDPLEDGRAELFQDVQIENFENAGHWVHHDQLDKFLKVVRPFLAK